MTSSDFFHRLRAGQTLFGTLRVSPSPMWPKVVPLLGLDFVFLDTEHVALDRMTLSWMCRTYTALGLPPIVRIIAPDPYLATVALDDGAAGVMAPYIESPEQARALVGATKRRPLRGKKLESILRNEEVVSSPLSEYIESGNAGHGLILNIESVAGMENLGEILEIEGIDGVIVGPHDLSTNLGVPEQYDHPDFIAAVDEVIDKTRAAGVGVGIHAGFNENLGIEAEKRWMRRGMNVVLHSADILAFRQSMQRDIATLREAAGEIVENDERLVNI